MEITNQDISGFSNFLLTQGRKQTTVYRHVNCLKILASNVSTFSGENISGYLLSLKLGNKRHSYLNHFIDSACLYCRFKGWDEPRCKRYPDQPFQKATLSDSEIEDFLALTCPIVQSRHRNGKVFTRRSDPVGWDRKTLFWKICAFTGMRMGETAHLTIDSIDFGRGVFVLSDTKTNDPRLVPIPPNIETDIKTHLAGLRGQYLFPSPRGGNHNGTGAVMDSVDWHYDFHNRIKRLGIRRTNLTPYSLRHSLITRLLEEDVNLFKVQKLVGHRRIDTTVQYTHLTTRDIKDALRKDPMLRRSIDPRGILVTLIERVTALFERDDRFDKTVEDYGDEVVIRVKIKKE